MELILDACTIIHLLQADIEFEKEDEPYFNHNFFTLLDKLECNITILKVVLDEVNENASKNLTARSEQKLIKNYIDRNIHKYVSYSNFDYLVSLPFVKKVNNYTDDNGELHCTTYALHWSRYVSESIFSVHLFTDDDGVTSDFKEFFEANSLGQILATVDLLNILYQKELIGKQVVLNFAYNLKKLYVSEYNELLQLCKKANFSGGITGIKENALLTKLIGLLNNSDFAKISSDIITDSSFPGIKRNNKSLNVLLDKVLKTDYKKIAIIDKKILDLKHKVWDLAS